MPLYGRLPAPTLGSGTANNTTFLRGDLAWATPSGGGGGGGLPVTLVSGTSGDANASAAPSETWHVLTADAATNSTTSMVAVMNTQNVPVGSYYYQYMVRYQSALGTTGVKFAVDYTGTVTSILARHLFAVEASAASSLVADSGFAGTAAGLLTALETRTDNAVMGPSASVDTANADMLWTVEGLITVSTSATLSLMHGSEVAAASTVKAGTFLRLSRLS